MAAFCRWNLILTLLLAAARGLAAPSAEETRAFDAAAKAMQATDWERAEKLFGAFTREFTNSTLLADAVLYQAEARYQQTNYAGAIELLSTNLALAGTNGGEYHFWLGKSRQGQKDYPGAIEAFEKVMKECPASTRLLEACFEDASTRTKLAEPEWPRIVDLLRHTNGVFQSAARTNAASEWVPRGQLLLAEALLAQTNYEAAEAALQPTAKLLLKDEIKWQRQYLLCKIQLAQGRTEDALQGSAILMSLATNAAQPKLAAESATLRGNILEGLGRIPEAIGAYTNNLLPGVPAEPQRRAMLKITELSLAQNRVGQAAQMLVNFLSVYPESPSADLAWLTLGELRLRQQVAGPGTNGLDTVPALPTNAVPTNALLLAETAFETLTTNFPQSQYIGKGQLYLGWCFWMQDRLPESRRAFQTAVMRLPLSADLARAHFKLGDVQFRQKDYTNAVANYHAIIENFGSYAEVKTNLMEQALYQAARSGLAMGNLGVATNALRQIMAGYPNGFHTDQAALLVGQELGHRGQPGAARQIFSEFTKLAPEAALRPEIELAIARTYEEEGNWIEAIAQYNTWLERYSSLPTRPRAEYCRAYANFQAGNETNALMQFTNLVAQFPTNEYAPRAQWWVADYYFKTGNFTRAENDYQLLARGWPGSPLEYEARMMAGRAAMARQSWKDASNYFTKLYSETNCPEDLRVQALFAYGDTLMSQDSTNKLDDYRDAIAAFNKICDLYPTNRLAPLAWGEKANCRLQWAQSSQDYGPATNDFQKVLDSPMADATARSIAKVGLGVVLEKQAQQRTGADQTALLKLALNHYLDVFHGTILRPGEASNLFWTKKAGQKAADVAEALKEWSIAFNVCKQLEELLPQLRASLDKRMATAQERLRAIE